MNIRKINRHDSDIMDRIRDHRRRMAADVTRLLEKDFEMDMNLADKIVTGYFREGFLPAYYFLSHNAAEIAGHVFITTQLLNANTEFITHESRDGTVITYFVNVGRDFPGRLVRIIEENLMMDITAFNSVKTESGIRIMTMEKRGRKEMKAVGYERGLIEEIMTDMRISADDLAGRFLRNLPVNYVNEEVNIARAKSRIKRHIDLCVKAMTHEGVTVEIAGSDEAECFGDRCEVCVSVAARNAGRGFVPAVLNVFVRHRVNLRRSYLDTFVASDGADRVSILTLYTGEEYDLKPAAGELRALGLELLPAREEPESMLSREIEGLIRTMSDGESPREAVELSLKRLRALARENADASSKHELNNFYLNAITDFFAAADYIGLGNDADAVLLNLLMYESLGEFYVLSKNGPARRNLPGYRFAHNSLRGPGKGGLRLDPIVRFDEVCALSFMMTWKTARSRVLMGGAKGGLVIRPADFAGNRLDFIDTLANFGRSLFLLTGPMRDVPAGDVGCGADEIGVLFEGFKSALRDLVLVALGVKHGVTLIGHRVVPVEEARDILARGFAVDWPDRRVLELLSSSERYLELVTAAQITGKPRMGIRARADATGRGLVYTILALIGRLFLDGRWTPDGPISERGMKLLRKASIYTEEALIGGREAVLPDDEWDFLVREVYPLLLRNKRIVVQGTGNVGGSVLRELGPFGVNIIAVGDAGGAIIGDRLDAGEILREAAASPGKTCVGSRHNVNRVIAGAHEGAAILELECDILLPCALENVITEDVASRVRARIVAAGGNGTMTTRGARALFERGVIVPCDFLTNSGGVVASYFEWLRNLADRFRFESDAIYGRPMEIESLEPYIMPGYRERLLGILARAESDESAKLWNGVMRDIIFCALNDDYDFSQRGHVSMITAGFAHALLTVLAAWIATADADVCNVRWASLPEKTRGLLVSFLRHPEIARIAPPETYTLVRMLEANAVAHGMAAHNVLAGDDANREQQGSRQ